MFPSVIEFEKSQSPSAWTLPLPQITDLNEDDTVVASARLGVVASFMDFSAEQNDLSIADLSSEVVIEGLHENLSLTLDDSKDKTTYKFSLLILPVGGEANSTDSNSTLSALNTTVSSAASTYGDALKNLLTSNSEKNSKLD